MRCPQPWSFESAVTDIDLTESRSLSPSLPTPSSFRPSTGKPQVIKPPKALLHVSLVSSSSLPLSRSSGSPSSSGNKWYVHVTAQCTPLLMATCVRPLGQPPRECPPRDLCHSRCCPSAIRRGSRRVELCTQVGREYPWRLYDPDDFDHYNPACGPCDVVPSGCLSACVHWQSGGLAG